MKWSRMISLGVMVAALGIAADTAHAETTVDTAITTAESTAPVAKESTPSPSPESAPAPTVAPSTDDAIEELDASEVIQEKHEDLWYTEAYPRPERGINVLTGRTIRRNAWLFLVTHRTNAAFSKNAFHNFLGFDGGLLKVGLGLRYGILDTLDVGIFRLNGTVEKFDAYEFDARWQFLHANKHYVDMAVRGGLTWFSQQDATDAVGGFGQLLISRLLWKRLLLGVNFAFHSDSSNDRKAKSDTNYSLAVLGLAEVRLTDLLGIDVEVGQTMAGYRSTWPTMTLALKMLTNRHTFAVVVSNTQYHNADGIVANTWRGFEDLILGFNITREL